jgi:hypothetical protein
VVTRQISKVRTFLAHSYEDLETYAQRIGALTEKEVRMRKDIDEDTEERMHARNSIKDDNDEDDEWE